MVQSIEQYDLFGKVGKSLGTGLSEQLPKEIDRTRLAKGLQELRQQGQQGMNPFDAAVKIFSLPGLRPEVAATLMPLFQQELLRQQGQQQANQSNQPSQGQPNTSGVTPQGTASPISAEAQPFVGVGKQASIPSPYWDNSKKESMARQKMAQNPTLYPDYNTALGAVDKEEQVGITRYNEIGTLFDGRLADYLQKQNKSGTWENIPEEYLDKFRQQAYAKTLTGNVSPEDAAREQAQDALQFSKVREELKGKNFFNKTSRGHKKTYLDSLPAYERFGAKELFVQDLKNYHNISEPVAKAIAYPLSSEMKNAMSIYKNVDFVKNSVKPEKEKISDITEVIENINPDDSINTIMLNLKSKGFDDNLFIDTIKKLYQSDKLNLTKQQKNELDTIKPYPRVTMPDMWISAVEE